MTASMKIGLGLVLLPGCVGLIAWIAIKGRKTRVDARIDELSGRGGSVPERQALEPSCRDHFPGSARSSSPPPRRNARS